MVSIILPTLLWANLRNRYVWLAVLATFAYATVGFADDYIKIVRKRSLGLDGARKDRLSDPYQPRWLAVFLLYLMNMHQYDTKLNVPFFKAFAPDASDRAPVLDAFWFFGYLPFLIFISVVIVGSSNAVNLTDGLDGLAIGCTLIASAALTALTYVTGNARAVGLSRHLLHPAGRRADDLLWLDGRRQSRFPLVQRASGRSVHGRCRFARARRRDRNRLPSSSSRNCCWSSSAASSLLRRSRS